MKILSHTVERVKLWRTIDQHLELDGMLILLLVAIREGEMATEIGKIAGLSQSSASRWLLYWGTGSWSQSGKRKHGKGFVESRPDPMDNRVKRMFLTQMGREFFSKLQAAETTYQEVRKADGSENATQRHISR
jgi:DNA-binding MarR family transcriptional regulator